MRGQRQGENLALCITPAKLQHLTAIMASLFDSGAFLSEWGLPKAVVKAPGNEGYTSNAALLGLTEEDIGSISELKKEMVASCKPTGVAKPWYYCAKLDLQSAYRSVPIHPDNYKATGLAWRFEGEDTHTYVFDAWLPFGSACGPLHFSQPSNAIRRMMYHKVYKGVFSYIDDFLLACETYEECKEVLLYLINLVRKLGLQVSWKKMVSLTKQVTFLGVDIDTNECVLSLGANKLKLLHDKLKAFKHRQRATKCNRRALLKISQAEQF